MISLSSIHNLPVTALNMTEIIFYATMFLLHKLWHSYCWESSSYPSSLWFLFQSVGAWYEKLSVTMKENNKVLMELPQNVNHEKVIFCWNFFLWSCSEFFKITLNCNNKIFVMPLSSVLRFVRFRLHCLQFKDFFHIQIPLPSVYWFVTPV